MQYRQNCNTLVLKLYLPQYIYNCVKGVTISIGYHVQPLLQNIIPPSIQMQIPIIQVSIMIYFVIRKKSIETIYKVTVVTMAHTLKDIIIFKEVESSVPE